MGNIIDPNCGQPQFLIPDINTAFKCGSFNFIIVSVILTIIIFVILLITFNKTEVDPISKQPIKKTNWISIIFCTIGIILAWALVPLFGWIGSRSWSAKQIEIDRLAEGGDRSGVIKRMHKDYLEEQKARAIASANRSYARRYPHQPHPSSPTLSINLGNLLPS